MSTVHYSTQIEGNRLTLEQVEEVIKRESMFGSMGNLDTYQPALKGLFAYQTLITSREVATLFKLKSRTARYLCQRLVAEGFFVIANASKKKRVYALAPRFRDFL